MRPDIDAMEKSTGNAILHVRVNPLLSFQTGRCIRGVLREASSMEKPLKWVILLFVLSLVGFFTYTHLKSWHRENMEAALVKERETWVGKIDELGKEVDNLKGMLSPGKALPDAESDAMENGSALVLPIPSGQPKLSCEQLKQQMDAFFIYLDQRGYSTAHELEGDSRALFETMVEDLMQNPPVITGEMDDLSTLIRNVTHFYRVLGKKRIGWIIDILKKDSKPLEAIMETFYQWVLTGGQCNEGVLRPPPPEILYRYAGFFLNTLGGRSYLLRRDSRTRVLTSYYSILVLDRANDKVQNTYGIDIRPYIDFSFYDIKSQKMLSHQDRYLSKLKDLKKKYRM